MNRKRNNNESFAQYRANLKAEAETLKARKQGTFFHVSTRHPHRKGEGSTYTR